MDIQELRDRSVIVHTVIEQTITKANTCDTTDEVELIRLGKKPILQRNFGFMSILGFSCTVLVTWEGVLTTFSTNFVDGGPAGVIYGFLVVWIGTLSTFATISELASMAPVSGGQYHWVAMLSPKWCTKFLSYITAWMTFAGWQAITAGSCYIVGTMMQGILALTNSSYVSRPWQAMLMYWAVVLFALFINIIASRSLAKFEGIILILHIFGFFCVLIPLVYLGPHGNTSIFTQFINESGWKTQGLSFFTSLSAPIFTLTGSDSAVHMSEEIRNASIVVPRALMASLFINGVLGLGMILAVLFCMGNADDVIASQKTLGLPFLEIFLQGTKSVAGMTIMAVIVGVLTIFGTVGALAAASRMLWAFSRDGGLPFWRLLSKLDRRTRIPTYTVAVNTVVSILLSLVILGSSTAFNDLISLSVVGLYSSYLICCILLLWRRCKGDIKPPNDADLVVGPGHLAWGRWRLPGIYGIANNIFACFYLIVTIFFGFWPPSTPVSLSNMNFAPLVFGCTLGFSVVWYLVEGKKVYVGPVVEVRLEPRSHIPW